MERKVRVEGEEEDEALAHGACRAQDTWSRYVLEDSLSNTPIVFKHTALLLGKVWLGVCKVLCVHDCLNDHRW